MSEPPSVTLRAPTDADSDVLYGIAADLDTWEQRNASPPAPLRRERYEARLAETSSSPDVISFVVDDDGTAVGSVTLFGEDPFAGHAEMGIALTPEARGRGIGTAAIRQLVAFGFERRNLRRIHLQALASNVGAIRAYEKAGFVVEGRLREHAWVRGGYEDIVLMAILRDGPGPTAG